ncbi:hypothetical protein BT69DRAFT_1297128 [Atractiella rhizophila]|nr:hypothetical protein BT69DRAFT_1297128 [Atractiella rhizophila]
MATALHYKIEQVLLPSSTPSDHPLLSSITRTLTSAFLPDPTIAPIMGGSPELVALELETEVRCGLESGEVWIVRGGDAVNGEEDERNMKIMWWDGNSERQMHLFKPYADKLQESNPTILHWISTVMEPSIRRFGEKDLPKNYALDHWYIKCLGTHPAHQGKGIGAILVRLAITKAREDHLDLYLLTIHPWQVEAYEKMGLACLKREKIEPPAELHEMHLAVLKYHPRTSVVRSAAV